MSVQVCRPSKVSQSVAFNVGFLLWEAIRERVPAEVLRLVSCNDMLTYLSAGGQADEPLTKVICEAINLLDGLEKSEGPDEAETPVKK